MDGITRRRSLACVGTVGFPGCLGRFQDDRGVVLGELEIVNSHDRDHQFDVEISRGDRVVWDDTVAVDGDRAQTFTPDWPSDPAEYVIEARMEDGQQSSFELDTDISSVDPGGCVVVKVVVRPYGKFGVYGRAPIDGTGECR